jgi:hypothetical protein
LLPSKRRLSKSQIDFLDVHIYIADGSPAALAANLGTEEWSGVDKEKPVVMGEFGCNIHWYPNATACGKVFKQIDRDGSNSGGCYYRIARCLER